MKRLLVAASIYTAAAVALGYLLGRRMATIEGQP